jgi:hypothetical protein
LGNAVVGVMHAASLAIAAVGRGLAEAGGLNSKHATKQIDRLLSNRGIDFRQLIASWAAYLIGSRKEIVVALDWTEFDNDKQSTLALYLVTNHGRATPLLWKTVLKSGLKGKRNDYEDEVIEWLREVVPEDVKVTLLADRGFGDQNRYIQLNLLGFHYVIRFRQDIMVTDEKGESKRAIEWMLKSGRAKMLKQVQVTNERTPIPAVVVVRAKNMKEPWCLATDRVDLLATGVIKLYGKRFTIEETFRDTKDNHFGLGLSATHISNPTRRDRLLFLTAIAQTLLTLLGAAGEACGMDRMLKVNTVKRRTMSLFNQGRHWYNAIPNMPRDRLHKLMKAFDKIILEHPFFSDIFGTI